MTTRRRDDGMTLVELLISMTLSLLLVGVLVTCLALVLKTAIGESSDSTQFGGQNADFIPAQLEANAGIQQVARTFSSDVLNVVRSADVTSPGARACSAPAPGSDPKLLGAATGVLLMKWVDASSLQHAVYYEYTKNIRRTEAVLVRYECQGTSASIGTSTATARRIAAGLSSSIVPTFARSGTGIETFAMTLTNLGGRAYKFDATMRADANATLVIPPPPPPDPSKPPVTKFEMFDNNPVDGKVDNLVATFGTATAAQTAMPACWAASAWTLPPGVVPSGGTKGVIPAPVGNVITIPITPGALPADTAVGALTVAFLPDAATCALAPFVEAPIDKAPPVLTAFATGQGAAATVGMMEVGDTLTLTFSEALDASTVPANVMVTEYGGKSSSSTPSTLTITDTSAAGENLTAGALSMGAVAAYIDENKTAGFNGTTTRPVSTQVKVTLTGACVGGSDCSKLKAGTGTLIFTPSATLKDAAGNGATAVALPTIPGSGRVF